MKLGSSYLWHNLGNWRSWSRKGKIVFTKCQLYARHWSEHLAHTNPHTDTFSGRPQLSMWHQGDSPATTFALSSANRQGMMMVMISTYWELFPDTGLSAWYSFIKPTYKAGVIITPLCRWGNWHTHDLLFAQGKRKRNNKTTSGRSVMLWLRIWNQFCLRIY